MNRITMMYDILQEITGNTIVVSEIKDAASGIWLAPSETVSTMQYEKPYFYNLFIKTESLDLLESIGDAFLRAKTTLDFDFNNFDSRGTLNVTDGSEFTLTDAITGGTSGATGTVYKIVSNTLYLKDIVGVWQNAESILTYVSVTTSVITLTIFPFYINVIKIDEQIQVDYLIPEYWTWIQFEARWTL